ncbi:sensor histidine kinase [Aerococcaceae bacterium NML130460]|nr:sensor histidine kinase [Aerococcaceae bacterium NML130460]
MNMRLWIRLLGTQLFINSLIVLAVVTVLVQSGYSQVLDTIWNGHFWQVPIYSIIAALILAISVVYATYTMLTLNAPYELIRAKINWLLLGKYHHNIFREEMKERNWYDNTRIIANDLNHIREKMLQLSTDLQEFAEAPTFVGTETKEEIIEAERHRIARELHDSVSQQLFAATMMLSAVNASLNDELPESLIKQLKMIDQVIGTAQTEMRALLLHLRPIGLEGKSLKEGITQILQELQTKVPLDITWELTETTLASGNEDHLFRIVQEGVSNTLRHAKASKLEVYLRQTDSQVQLKIIDNGIGFDSAESEKLGSYGLLNMKERIASMGGTFKVLSFKDKGTVIDMIVPIQPPKEEVTT